MHYEVHFLIEKTVFIDSADDIQAEYEAAKCLSKEDRYDVRGFQYADHSFDDPIPLKEFYEPDFEGWKEQKLID